MNTIPALSARRVRAALDDRGQEYVTNDVEDTCFSLKGHDIWLLISGDPDTVFSVTSTDYEVVEIDRLVEVRAFIDDWHAETYWPVLAYSVADDGGLRLTAHVSTDWPAGITDLQIGDQIDVATANIMAAFREFRRFLAAEERKGSGL